MEISATEVDGSAKWLFMKEIPISEFGVHCSRLIQEVSRTNQPIRITRRGKAVAEVHQPSQRAGDWIGSMKDSMKILGDIVSPASEEDDWEVLRGLGPSRSHGHFTTNSTGIFPAEADMLPANRPFCARTWTICPSDACAGKTKFPIASVVATSE